MAKITPARRQYLDIKRQYPNAILMFRMGDFYEMFDEDAEIAARELDITLTGRRFGENSPQTPMAGVPHHAVEAYVARLIDRGYHVAVCDQMTEPDGRGIVEREVTRVMTPGTVTEPALLNEAKANYLLAILPLGDPKAHTWHKAGVAYVDISTGEFAATQFEGEDVAVQVLEELTRLSPRELLLPQSWAGTGVTVPEGCFLTPAQDWLFDPASVGPWLTMTPTRRRHQAADSRLCRGQTTRTTAPRSGYGRFLKLRRAPERSSSVLAMKKPRPMPSWRPASPNSSP